MATANDSKFSDLKARVEATGHKLVRDMTDRMYILDAESEQLIAIDLDDKTIETELAYLEGKGSKAVRPEQDDEPAESDERPVITVLVGDCCDAIFGIHGIAQAIVNLDERESISLALALRELAKRLYSAMGSVRMDAQQKIEAATGWQVRQ